MSNDIIVSVSLDKKLVAAVMKEAEATKKPFDDVIVRIISEQLDKMPP